MKVNLCRDELFPHYLFNVDYTYSELIVDLTDEEYEFIQNAYKEFFVARDILRTKYEASSNS